MPPLTIEHEGVKYIRNDGVENELRFAFAAGFSTARPVPEPPHRHSDEDCELMRHAFPYDFSFNRD